MADEDDGFLRRWSARKAETKTKEAEADPTIAAVDPEAHPVPATDAKPATEEAVAVEDLPDIETLDKDSDFTVFLKEGVPEKLRNMALRKLWLSDPVLANVDGLVDYGEDFTDAALVVEGMKSAYQVGKGFITEEDEKKMAEQAAAEAAEAEKAAAESEAAAEGSGEDADDTPPAESEEASGEEPAGDPDAAETTDAESEDDPIPEDPRQS